MPAFSHRQHQQQKKHVVAIVDSSEQQQSAKFLTQSCIEIAKLFPSLTGASFLEKSIQ
jgi:hypothetical protein